MRCRFCGYPRLSLIKVWEDEEGRTWRRFGCFSCHRKFDAAEEARKEESGLSQYARRW